MVHHRAGTRLPGPRAKARLRAHPWRRTPRWSTRRRWRRMSRSQARPHAQAPIRNLISEQSMSLWLRMALHVADGARGRACQHDAACDAACMILLPNQWSAPALVAAAPSMPGQLPSRSIAASNSLRVAAHTLQCKPCKQGLLLLSTVKEFCTCG